MRQFRQRWPKWFEHPGSLPDCGEGWYPLLMELCESIEQISDNKDEQFRVLQVKEKFGGLRFYVSYGPDMGSLQPRAIQDLIKAAEAKSYHVCERCGEPGTLRRDSWLKTRCDACYEVKP